MQINKIIFPLVLIVTGLISILYGFSAEQNGLFKLGAAVILLTGVISFLSVSGVFNKTIRIAISVTVGLICLTLSYFDYNSIQEPLKFEQEKNTRFTQITQRLKDIREAQKSYKNVYKKYAPTFDSLKIFVNTGQVPVLKAFGNIPDGMTEAEAIQKGYYKKTVIMVDAKSSIFNDKYMKDRPKNLPLTLDSIEFIPSCGAEKFVMTTGAVVKNNVSVPTIEVIAPNDLIFKNWPKHFYASISNRKFGSTTDPGINGNWE